VSGGPLANVPLATATCPRWAFVNTGAYGYFRTAYTPALLRAMAPDIASRFTEPERLTIIGDEWALVRAGRHSVADYLTLAAGFTKEHSSGVFEELSSRLTFIHDYLTTNATRPKYEQWVRSLVGPLYRELGINASPADDDDTLALRADVIRTLDLSGNDPALATEARAALSQLLSGKAPIDASAAAAVAGVAARHGNQELFDRLLAAAQHATSPSERNRYLFALGAFEDPTVVDRGLNFATTADLRSQDTSLYVRAFLNNPAARDRTWAFVKQHWPVLGPKLTIAGGDLTLAEALGSFCDARSRDDIREFFRTHKLPAASRALDQTIERINNCVAMKSGQSDAVATWLETR